MAQKFAKRRKGVANMNKPSKESLTSRGGKSFFPKERGFLGLDQRDGGVTGTRKNQEKRPKEEIFKKGHEMEKGPEGSEGTTNRGKERRRPTTTQTVSRRPALAGER